MTQPVKILAFAGSLRHDSYNKKLVQLAVDGARRAGAEVTYIDLRDYPLPLYDQEIEDREGLPENAVKLKELMIAHQGFLISTPEYNSSIPGVLKNVIDWASRDPTNKETPLICFKGKVAAIMSASPGQLGGLRSLVTLRSILSNIDVLVLPQQRTISMAHEAFNSDGSLKNARHQEAVDQLAAKLVQILTKLN